MLLIIPTALIGLVIVSGAPEGYFGKMGNLATVARILLIGAGLSIAIPGSNADLYGIGALAVIFALYYLLRWGRSPLLKLMVTQTRSETHDKK